MRTLNDRGLWKALYHFLGTEGEKGVANVPVSLALVWSFGNGVFHSFCTYVATLCAVFYASVLEKGLCKQAKHPLKSGVNTL